MMRVATRRATFTILERRNKQRRSHLGTENIDRTSLRPGILGTAVDRRREPTFRAGDLQSADRSRCALPIGPTWPEAHARRHAEA